MSNNEIPKCDRCGRAGVFEYGCNGSQIVGSDCRWKRHCSQCRRFCACILKFGEALCRTEPAERSNSKRARYFGVLLRAVRKVGKIEAMPERDFAYISDALDRLLGEGGAFARDRKNFAGTIMKICCVLPSSKEIMLAFNEAILEDELEKATIAADRATAEAKSRREWAERTALEIGAELRAVDAKGSFRRALDEVMNPRESSPSFAHLLGDEIAKQRSIRGI